MEKWCTWAKAPSEGHYVSKGKCLLRSRLPAVPATAGLAEGQYCFHLRWDRRLQSEKEEVTHRLGCFQLRLAPWGLKCSASRLTTLRREEGGCEPALDLHGYQLNGVTLIPDPRRQKLKLARSEPVTGHSCVHGLARESWVRMPPGSRHRTAHRDENGSRANGAPVNQGRRESARCESPLS